MTRRENAPGGTGARPRACRAATRFVADGQNAHHAGLASVSVRFANTAPLPGGGPRSGILPRVTAATGGFPSRELRLWNECASP